MSKSARKRPCPALARDLTPAECGEHRVSRFACPPDCPFNPFAPANYGQFLELEEAVDDASLSRLRERAADPVAVKAEMQRAMADRHATEGGAPPVQPRVDGGVPAASLRYRRLPIGATA